MKIESLAIIFVIIVVPLAIILSQYIDNKLEIAYLESEYDVKLINAAKDAILSFQINNINNSYNDISTSKVKDIEVAANAYLNALSTNFGFSGYNKEVVTDYVPAIVFTLYDGYYVFSPYKNKLTTTEGADNKALLKFYGIDSDPIYGGTVPNVQVQAIDENNSGSQINVDEDFSNGKQLYGLKPYVYYSCRYTKGESDFVITYSLDNYITVQGIVKRNYVYKYRLLNRWYCSWRIN